MRFAPALLAASLALVASLAGGVAADGVTGVGSGATEPESPTRSDGEVSTLRAQERLAGSLETVDDVQSARANGTLTRNDTVVAGDTLVVRIRSTHVDEAFAETAGDNTTDRFFRMLSGSGTNLTIRALVGPQVRPFDLALARSDPRVLRDASNETFYVVVDTASAALVYRGSDETVNRNPGYEDYEIVVETRDDGVTFEKRHQFGFASPEATVRSPTAGLRLRDGSGPGGVAGNATDLALSGYSNVLPGTNLSVRAVGPNGTTLATDRVATTRNASQEGSEVDPREVVRSDFDATLTDVPTDSYEWFELQVAGGDATLWSQRVVVGPPPRWSNLSAEVVDRPGRNWTVRVNATLRLPDEGVFSVVVDSDDGLRNRRFAVPAGRSHQQVTLSNATEPPDGTVEVDLDVFWDANDDGEYDSPMDRSFKTVANVTGTAAYGRLEARLTAAGVDRVRPTGTASPGLTATAVSRSSTSRPETTATERRSSPGDGRQTTGTARTQSPIGSVDTGSPTRRRSTTAEPTTGPTKGDTTEADSTRADTTTADGPAFDVVAAVAAVTGLAVALGARRRRRR